MDGIAQRAKDGGVHMPMDGRYSADIGYIICDGVWLPYNKRTVNRVSSRVVRYKIKD